MESSSERGNKYWGSINPGNLTSSCTTCDFSSGAPSTELVIYLFNLKQLPKFLISINFGINLVLYHCKVSAFLMTSANTNETNVHINDQKSV
jgi:hypothetical protein